MQHYLTATRIDVLHSPFVFSLYQQCIAKEHDFKAYQSLEKIRTYLRSVQTEIHFEDYGASSNSRKVAVKTLAKQHLKPARIAQILHRIIAFQNYENVLELGTSLGLSTCYLALSPGVKVTTIEGSKAVWEQAQRTFEMAGITQQIISHSGTFEKVLPQILLEKPSYDLIFIDGNHSYEATLRYVKQLRPFLSQNGMMVLDDIYWSHGMTQAWEELKPSFNVSIDLFFIGILSQRTEQAKEDFKLRVW
jgi:predicted O-methyltransferase YrrM